MVYSIFNPRLSEEHTGQLFTPLRTIAITACTLSRVQRLCELRVIQFLVLWKNSPMKARMRSQRQELVIPPFVLQLLKRSPGFRNLRCIRAFENYILCYVINHTLRRVKGQHQHLTNIQAVTFIHPLLDYCFWIWCMQSPAIWKYSNLLELYTEFCSIDKERRIWAQGSERIFYWKQYSRCIQNCHPGDI